MTTPGRERLADRLRQQSRACHVLGSPLYADLLDRAADDVSAGGPCAAVLDPYADEPGTTALPLRLMAAVHRVVLRRQAPALALHYASVGGTAPVEGAWEPFRAALEEHGPTLTELTALPCQTNEVGRSAALAPGLLGLQRAHGLPLHHLEIGSSAGLNLRWDHFRYGTADLTTTWGDPGSPVDLTGHWVVPPSGLPDVAEVVGRRGCDPRPGDPATAATREDLTASVWGDQHARHERLRGALALAARVPARVDAERAAPWLARQLADRPGGVVTVVTHSVVWQYVPVDEQREVLDLLDGHGRDAFASAPLVHLHLEPATASGIYEGGGYPVTATTWPGGTTEVLGSSQAHGQEVRWAG